MLVDSKSFSSFSSGNLKASKNFYKDLLGLKVSENNMGLLELDLKESKVLIYPKSDHKPADFTVLNFYVLNIEKGVDELVEKGVSFEHYEGALTTNSKGIHRGSKGPDIAWFKDPSGNILSIIEMKK